MSGRILIQALPSTGCRTSAPRTESLLASLSIAVKAGGTNTGTLPGSLRAPSGVTVHGEHPTPSTTVYCSCNCDNTEVCFLTPISRRRKLSSERVSTLPEATQFSSGENSNLQTSEPNILSSIPRGNLRRQKYIERSEISSLFEFHLLGELGFHKWSVPWLPS